MDLPNLKLNRLMYRVVESDKTPSSVAMSSEINKSADPASEQKLLKGGGGEKRAREIITGTVITSCLIKSSDGDDRVEIGQNLEFAGGTSDVDYLAVFNGNNLSILMTKFGLTVVSTALIQGNLDVIDRFRYAGETGVLVIQPVNFWLRLMGGTDIRTNAVPSGWTVTHLTTGEYEVTHNLGHDYYAVTATISSDVGWLAGGFAATSFVGINSFVINTFDDTGTAVDADWSCMVAVSPTPP